MSKPNRALPFRNEEELFPNDENKCRELLFVFKYFFKVELMKNPLGVMSHSTATFVVQKLMEMCEPSSLEMYMSIVEKYFLALSVHLAGCRVVQKCLALANYEQNTRIGLMLENCRILFRLLRNKNGTYVAQVELIKY